MAQALIPSAYLTNSSSIDLPRTSAATSTIFGPKLESVEIEQTHFRLLKPNSSLRLKASREPLGLTRELTNNKDTSVAGAENGCDVFNEMKHRFLSFKKHTYLENLERFQNLAKSQAPKFMVIACADSRVCPSSILGFQPGEAFVVRNVANLVPPFENGPSETNAALEFSVNSLEVENILVIGHSCCGGIRALMSMQDEINSSFIRSWVIVGKNARLSTKAATSNLNFDQQCRHCEKESLNRSLLNLLTYPWIKERVSKGLLSIHGGYYDFINCTFEKWTLEYQGSSLKEESGRYSLRNREFWC
ncbi:beta carbonic anhydrase 5, chloroplastic-like isoform X2 [Cornus florida]|uniref:beta carbonic anhydrase 5, chloroplastic-like isoform X2 n=1 Tax=Cornus florida TaxID=4283 RepID=UPI0028964CF9|nr:beta carbonic anhydrase 5, chloroplastic-like isoform X2 [Cornus florida]